MQTAAHTIPTAVQTMMQSDSRIVRIREYQDGFVPRSYHYAAPGTYVEYHRDGRIEVGTYDRKRSNGRGPWIVGYSARGGRLASRQ